jgi:hypothetical protein
MTSAYVSNWSLDMNSSACESTALIICALMPCVKRPQAHYLVSVTDRTDLIPANKSFVPPDAREELQSAGVLVPCIVVARVWCGLFSAFFFGLLDISGTSLYADLGHDVRIRHLQKERRVLNHEPLGGNRANVRSWLASC